MVEYRPKNILITGGAGFIGSNVILHLIKNYDYTIINYDKLDYCATLKNLEEIKDIKYKFIQGDILSYDLLIHIFETEKIDTVMHFAAQSHVDASFKNSFQFTETNIFGTHVICEAIRNSKQIKRFIHVSTDEVYGETVSLQETTEEAILKPTNPYSASKAGAELIVQAYYKSFQLPIIITRGNNVYGPRQYPEKVIPKFICLLAQNKPCTIHGNGLNKRSFIYVDDVANAFDKILHYGQIGEVYNIGTDFEKSTLDLAKDLLELIPSYFPIDTKDKLIFVEDRPYNDFRYSMNYDKLKNLGWTQKVDWQTGLRLTIEWYKNNVIASPNEYWERWTTALHPHPKF